MKEKYKGHILLRNFHSHKKTDPEQNIFHHQHHLPFKGYAFHLFGIHDVHIFLGRPTALLHLGLYSEFVIHLFLVNLLPNVSCIFDDYGKYPCECKDVKCVNRNPSTWSTSSKKILHTIITNYARLWSIIISRSSRSHLQMTYLPSYFSFTSQ